MKRFIITESEKSEIRKMYGLINEQTGGIVPQLAIKAISEIEKKFSFMDSGQIKGANYTGSEKLGVMSQYIKDTIGFDCWNTLSDVFKAQIYSYCFQADTDSPYKMKFIAGLANAIDPNIDRSTIVRKPLNDPNVQKAINTIKTNCNNINSYYRNYVSIVDQQYKSSDYNDNYKYIWKYRPTAIERIMNGEDFIQVLKDWEKSFNSQQNQGQQNNQTNNNTINVSRGSIINYTTSEYTDLNELNKEFKTKVRNLITQNGNKNYLVKKFEITNSNYKCSATIILSETKEKGFNAFSVLFNPSGTPQTSLNNALSKNPGSEKIGKPKTINLKNSDGSTTSYECHLVGIPLNN